MRTIELLLCRKLWQAQGSDILPGTWGMYGLIWICSLHFWICSSHSMKVLLAGGLAGLNVKHFMLAQASAQMSALLPDAIRTPDISQSILLPNVTEGDKTSDPLFGHIYNGMQSSPNVTFSQDASRALPVADQQQQRFGLLTTYRVCLQMHMHMSKRFRKILTD